MRGSDERLAAMCLNSHLSRRGWRSHPPVGLISNRRDRMNGMVIVRATRRLLKCLGTTPATDVGQSTTLLGDWYATVLPWRPRQTALFVSEKTLLPVLMPFAPAATLLDRFPDQLAHVLARHQVDAVTVARECIDTTDYQVATTASRSVVGSMNEFSFLADAYRQDDPELDLLDLSIRLSAVPCGPLYRRHVSPDRELQALLKDT